jgi:hypothetical protein
MKSRLSLILFVLFINSASAQIPAINQQIVDYVKSVIGTKVDRGECWDLANEALTRVNAQWDHKFNYGEEVNPEKDSIYPGDIIHFENVVLKYKKDNAIYSENYPQHTAIVYRVLGPGEYEIAHQNTSFTGKKVGLSTLRLKDKKSGKWKFYRPKAG